MVDWENVVVSRVTLMLLTAAARAVVDSGALPAGPDLSALRGAVAIADKLSKAHPAPSSGGEGEP